MAQPVVTHSAVKSLYVGILLRVAWLDIPQRNPLLLRPLLELFADVFRTIITADSGWFAPPLDDLLQHPFDSRGRQGKIHLDAQCFAIEVIDHIKQPHRTTIAELVMHKVHRPTVIRLVRDCQRLRLGPH